eukprot:3891075-Prymnesium_polylepis.1
MEDVDAAGEVVHKRGSQSARNFFLRRPKKTTIEVTTVNEDGNTVTEKVTTEEAGDTTDSVTSDALPSAGEDGPAPQLLPKRLASKR